MTSIAEAQQQFAIKSIAMKHFLKKHPDEEFDESKFEELRLSKTIMEPHKPYQKFKYHCYLCTHTKGQLISKCPYEKSVSSKIPMKIFLDFCPEIFCSFLGASW